MNIKDIQVKRATENILKNLIKSGVNPDESTFLYYLNEYFKENIPGIPSMKLDKIEEYQPLQEKHVMDSEPYNKMLDEIEEDLQVLYQAIFINNKKSIENFSYIESVRAKYVHKLNTLQNKIDGILEESTSSSINKVISEPFYDFSQIINEETTALIDLNNNSATLTPKILNSTMGNVLIDDIKTINIQPQQSINYEEITPPKYFLNDYHNESYVAKFYPKKDIDSLQEISIEFEINFKEKIDISHIDITTNDKEQKKLELSYLDTSWETIYLKNNEFIQNDQWTFNKVKTDKIRLKIIQEIKSTNLNNYYPLTIQNISFYNTVYNMSGHIKTDFYDIDSEDVFNKISIDMDMKDCQQTNVDLKVNLKDNNDKVITKFINNNESIILGSTTTSEVSLPYDTIKRASLHDSYGIKYFRLDTQLDNIIIDETKLFKGVGQWKKKTFQYFRDDHHHVTLKNWNDVEGDTVEYTSTMSKYVSELFYTTASDIYTLKYFYIDPTTITLLGLQNGVWQPVAFTHHVMENGADGSYYIQHNDTLSDLYKVSYDAQHINYMYETYIYSNKATTYKTQEFNITPMVKDKNYPYKNSLYVNNSKAPVEEGTDTFYYNINLKEGWNRIIFVDYRDSGINQDLIPLDQIDAKEIRPAKKSLTFVNYYDFINNIKKQEHDYFTIYNGNIILNNPVVANYNAEIIKPINQYKQISMDLFLSTKNKYLSPQIKNININFSY